MPLQIQVTGRTDPGITRRNNEDTFLIVDLSSGQLRQDTEIWEQAVGPAGLLVMVADGMGGAVAGEVASAMALEQIASWFANHNPEGGLSDGYAEMLLNQAVVASNVALFEHASGNPHLRGMGSTLTCAWIRAESVHIAQVGDSRAYLLRDGKIRQLTQDQSLREHLIAAKGMSPEEADGQAKSNVILQAMGVQPKVQPVTSSLPMQAGDLMLLCSDGLTTTVDDEGILQILASANDLSKAAESLVEAANARGGPDNVTVVMLQVDAGGKERAVPQTSPLNGADTIQTANGQTQDLASPTPPETPPPETPPPEMERVAAAAKTDDEQVATTMEPGEPIAEVSYGRWLRLLGWLLLGAGFVAAIAVGIYRLVSPR